MLLLFLDGVGLGSADPSANPLERARMPNLTNLLGGCRLVAGAAPLETEHAMLVSLDACLSVEGPPQSATGQATLLTGHNVPKELGYHYGPKPNPPVAEYLRGGNLFTWLRQEGCRTALLNAYPPSYFDAISSGHRLYSAIPLAAISAGLSLRTAADLKAGSALSADFTGEGWHDRLGLADIPVCTPVDAGNRLAQLAASNDFSLFEYWLSDYAGHAQDMHWACNLLETLDQVLGGLTARWDGSEGLILITSDHGNLEDLSVRGHTSNPVPALIIGTPELRRPFAISLRDLSDVAPAILRFLTQRTR